MSAREQIVASVDWILFAALGILGAVGIRYEVTGMLGDGIAFLGTAVSLIGLWIGARYDRKKGYHRNGGRVER